MNSMRNIQSTPIVLLLFLSLMLALMAEARNAIAPGCEMEKVKKEKATVYMVDIIRPKGVNYKKADIRVLVPVLGSEKAAKKAIIYHYKLSMSGFAAKLTPSQVKHLKKQPSVLGVSPDRINHLDQGPGGWVSGAV
ncbi:hypothetical protein LUZ61_011398 [Rhynchospora tenuis]|uniref:Inhibitor I9 domain-containing protein n=1 Tax=Rhynchospora tenuis TaxID=198213 RepID=A0AAD6A1D4_9POAL|nr:hypothetical protein LUZ61_011398 [Rhynchospora tenuis]